LSYDLIDWFLDAVDRGQCLSCKGFTLDLLGDAAQCYSCGKWFCGYDIGSSYSSIIELSTTYQRQQNQRQSGQNYVSERFEEELSKTPKSPEDFGEYPEEDV